MKNALEIITLALLAAAIVKMFLAFAPFLP